MTDNFFSFQLAARQGSARAGVFSTPHGDILTPVFAPVGTQATVKAVTPEQLQQTGASLVLANTYHLFLRPGADRIAAHGGLHPFMQWFGPMLTDSGGFQVFSLSAMRKVDDEGVTFKSHIDGSLQRLTPEISVNVQEKLGADIIMAFDECAVPDDYEYNRQSMARTHAWLERCIKAKTRTDQALFGIVQGGIFPDLRRESAQFVSSLSLPGVAIGGLSVGETKKEMHATLELLDPLLPQDRPRYLMGVGSPEDLINGILRGVDIFDCVLPTRLARHQAAFTPNGRVNLMNSANADIMMPIDESCQCYTCRTFTRAYLRHLIIAREMLASTLISIHNIQFLITLMNNARQAILNQCFPEFASEFLDRYQPSRKKELA
ncbi:MAG TPA: tRNA guanosine(34) transglycosylase Tgt [Anaerolineaceae bacterium]|nr:tRNA guanosine(34) transglycosylase Tgt [Anaerolineaceae bacterium]